MDKSRSTRSLPRIRLLIAAQTHGAQTDPAQMDAAQMDAAQRDDDVAWQDWQTARQASPRGSRMALQRVVRAGDTGPRFAVGIGLRRDTALVCADRRPGACAACSSSMPVPYSTPMVFRTLLRRWPLWRASRRRGSRRENRHRASARRPPGWCCSRMRKRICWRSNVRAPNCRRISRPSSAILCSACPDPEALFALFGERRVNAVAGDRAHSRHGVLGARTRPIWSAWRTGRAGDWS